MNEDLENEVEAINSIYGDQSLLLSSDSTEIYILRLPQHDTSLRLRFPNDYPAAPPAVLGIESTGEHTRKGDAAHIVNIFRDVLGRLYQPGEVCLFDVIEEVNSTVPSTEVEQEPGVPTAYDEASASASPTNLNDHTLVDAQEVPWILSDVVVELKSIFIARSTSVSSPEQAKLFLQLLLDSDKKVRSATHNITAWRIKGENGVTYQDCDDDGETAAGGRVLHLMQLMDIWNVMVVVTRCTLLEHGPSFPRV